ncbi:hypothetical protein BJ742DRAFT_860579 [Cladochytrium replicatum]|nr:hypothetical protein BJ742DRAFT_860579 [Cladochytrium replicatum]
MMTPTELENGEQAIQPLDDLLLQFGSLVYSGTLSQNNGLSSELGSSSSVVPQSGSTPSKLQVPFIMDPCTSTSSSSATSTSCHSTLLITEQDLSDLSTSSCGDTLTLSEPAQFSGVGDILSGAAMFTTPSSVLPVTAYTADSPVGKADAQTTKSQTKLNNRDFFVVGVRPKWKTNVGMPEKKASGVQASPSGGRVRSKNRSTTAKRSHQTVLFPQTSHGFVSLCKIVPPSQLAPQPAMILSNPAPSPAHTERLANLHTHLRKASHIASLIIAEPESLISEGFLFSASYAVSATVVHHTCNCTPSPSPSRLRVASVDSGIDVSSPPPTPSPGKFVSKQECACRPFAIPLPTQLHPEDVVLAMDQQTALASVANRWALTRSAFGLLFSVPAPVGDPTMLSSSNAERSLLYLFSLVPETNQWMVLLV